MRTAVRLWHLLAAAFAAASTIPQQPVCDVLAFSGGGSFGAVELGILDGLVTNNEAPTAYDVITGISAGGLNAGFLSYYNNVSTALPELHSIIANLTTADVYQSAILNILSDWSIYSTVPLESTVAGILASRSTPPAPPPITLIGATNVNTQALDVFRFDTMTLGDRVDTLMATSAIPLAFPPRSINGSVYVDGGVINNEMIAQAMGHKPCDFYQVTFISAASRDGVRVVNGFFSYLSAVGHVLLDTFDYQLAQYQSATCQYPRGVINACFPTAPELENYSILDFDYGAELWALGRATYNCTKLQIC
jgi:predicted acylesterase/phospholipase RssA